MTQYIDDGCKYSLSLCLNASYLFIYIYFSDYVITHLIVCYCFYTPFLWTVDCWFIFPNGCIRFFFSLYGCHTCLLPTYFDGVFIICKCAFMFTKKKWLYISIHILLLRHVYFPPVHIVFFYSTIGIHRYTMLPVFTPFSYHTWEKYYVLLYASACGNFIFTWCDAKSWHTFLRTSW